MQESEIDQSHLFITTAAVQIIEKFMLEIEKSHPAFSLELQWNELSRYYLDTILIFCALGQALCFFISILELLQSNPSKDY